MKSAQPSTDRRPDEVDLSREAETAEDAAVAPAPGAAGQSDRAAPRAARRRRTLRRALLLCGTLPVIYGAGLIYLLYAQETMIFPRAFDPLPPPVGPTKAGVQSIWLTAPDGVRVEAWYQPGAGCSADQPGPAVIFFHGNGDLIDERWGVCDAYTLLGYNALTMEYRGYGRVGGKPGQQKIVADAERFRAWLAARPEVDSSRIIYHGLSLGGGVAAALAERVPPAALILECTFVSMEAMGQRYLVPPGLCRHPFRTEQTLRRLEAPVLVMHGVRDWTVPVWHGRRLAQAARRSTYVELPCGHHDYAADWPALRAFLCEHGGR